VEERVTIPTDGGHTLEGGFTTGKVPGGAVITHPHPLYGGSMDSNVVLAARSAMEDCGLSALRFNFRGVGRSSGRHDDGRGEVDDLRVAMDYLHERLGNGDARHMIGYSFGAAIALRAVRDGLQPATLTLVSPPVDFMSFRDVALPACPCLVVVGEQDDFCSISSLSGWLERAGNHDFDLEIIPHADHFYVGRDHLVKRQISRFFKQRAGS